MSSDALYPALSQLLSCYFHEDWALESASPREAVDLFLRSEPGETVQRAAADLDRLLAGDLDDAALSALLLDLGSAYDPAYDDLPAREWLREVRSWLEP
jgi:hypothetical protein